VRDTDAERALREDIAAIARIDIIPTILDVVCRTTRMRFAAVARVTESRWIACSVKDDISFGLVPGSELRIETTICNEIRQHGQAVIIDNVAEDPAFCAHHTPVIYGFKSYISLPITLPDGTFFGTLCAIDPEAARLNTPEVVGMFRAFAELIALHLKAQQRLDRTEASLLSERSTAELREQFIAVLGHDLRVPLAAITSGAEILQHSPQPDRVTKLAVMMQRSVKRMAELIDNVLDFARGRLGGGLVLERQVESLQPILQQVVDELQSAWPDRVITLDIALPRAVRCDPVRIGQLVANLLGNALAHGTANTPVKLAATIVDGVLDVTVTNTGDRIPDAMLSRMFEPFVHAAGGPRQQGLGLGLYIANEIARAHGGSLAATSCAGEVRFTFRMLVG
jgi:signal transduction histidine kinase